ncbi:MAG TPA: 4-phosphoerythronate dehydrogenase PdxB [Pseudomonas xinjiangensis]|uniref:Erythronate-4-phosphate dehydrogenase n=2 Tax=root TaxID=1 RepID=A0A7V1BQ72_9GAMM|nr:4-phosphoerythronate dehydrogenase PdxB [Halopseudomonas xinjiangensis]HEC48772.1 4-phosphoerythronate dehydrogenase PdxB [Halopseudomonas xinjiangensis]
MHIVADENIPLLEAFFAGFGSLTRLPGRSISRAVLDGADVLLVRSVTQVTAQMLENTTVRFVGTCTIGTDHLDLPGLEKAGIQVASAPGCNARGVVEYVLSCLLTFAERSGQDWQDKVVGILGVGEVGSRLADTLGNLGVRTLLCDPLRAERGEAGFVDLETLIALADVITCHVPLTRSGAHPTWHLLNSGRLGSLKAGAWLINSSRGPVVDNQALCDLLGARQDLLIALDVWEQEPSVSSLLAARCGIATPHVAGYSLDGKLRGTAQIYQAFCQFLNVPVALSLDNLLPAAGTGQLKLSTPTPERWLLAKALRCVYDVRDDDARFRAMLADALDDQARRAGFDSLRKHYPLRRECSSLRVEVDESQEPARRLLCAAGFRL